MPVPVGFCICLFAIVNDEMMDLIALQCRSTSADVAWLPPPRVGWHRPLLLRPRKVPPTNASTHRTSPPGRHGSGGGWTLPTPSPTARYKCGRSSGCAQGLHLGCPTLSPDPGSSTRAAVKLRGVMSPCKEVTFGWAGRSLGHRLGWLCPTCPQPRALPEQPQRRGPGTAAR